MLWNNTTGFQNYYAGFGNRYLTKTHLYDLLSSKDTDLNVKIIELNQIHSARVSLINSTSSFCKDADAMVTRQRGVALVIRTADCFPVLLIDPIKQVIAAIHSGREGTRLNICRNTIRKMKTVGADTQNILAAIGPGISKKHYQVSHSMWREFCSSTAQEQEFPYLDLRKVIKSQLIECDISINNIVEIKSCTYSDSNFYSYRRNQTQLRQYNWIMLL